MVKLIPYKFTKMVNMPSVWSAKEAVVNAICPKEAFENDHDSTFNLILERWRSRVKTLYWREAIPLKRYSIALNCRPSVFAVDPPPKDTQGWYCEYDAFCPWCYMRRVQETYKACVAVIREHKGAKIVQLRRTLYTTFEKHPVEQLLRDMQFETRTFAAANFATTNGANSAGEALGTLWSVFAEPAVQKGDKAMGGCWRVGGRILLLVPPGGRWIPGGTSLPRQRKIRTAWTHLAHAADDKQFRKDLAAHLKYPVGLLRGHPKRAAQVIKARAALARAAKGQRVYFSGVAGVFRRDLEEESEVAIETETAIERATAQTKE